MAIAAVRRVHLLAHRDEADELVSFLQKAGVVEVTASRPEEASRTPDDTAEETALLLRRADSALSLLRPWMAKRTLRQQIYDEKVVVTPGEAGEIESSFDLEGFLGACEEKSRRIASITGEIAAAQERQTALRPWSDLPLPPGNLRGFRTVDALTGRLPASRVERVAAAVRHFALLEKVSCDERECRAVLFCHRDRTGELKAVLAEAQFVEEDLPAKTVPAGEIARLDREVDALEAEREQLRDSLGGLASQGRQLLVMRDIVASRLERLRCESLMGGTKRTLAIEGWAQAEALPALRRGMAKHFRLTSLEDFAPDPRERVPVLLSNPAAVRPFGLVVDLYGLPRYGTVDPSTVMAVFFALFFGLCLTDAGYGIVLAALTGGLLLGSPAGASPGRTRFLRLICLCGVATILTGAAAGGWFGLQSPVRLFDPLENLMVFFVVALAAGTLHLFAGLALRMTRLLRAGDVLGAVADNALWMVLILSLYAAAAVKAGLLTAGAGPAASAAAFGSALGIVFFQGRPDGNSAAGWAAHLPWAGAVVAGTLWLTGTARPWSGVLLLLLPALAPLLPGTTLKGALTRLGLGLYALYGITGYLSDVLSYSRLVALGLGTGIVALVVNKMALVAAGAPLVGLFAAGIVLAVGHLFNLVINLLGAFVHSCRLQYVEFFTKFYESGGRPLAPFRLASRYITISQQT